jgi:hypothetical protein
MISNAQAKGIIKRDKVSFQIPKGSMIDLHKPMSISYTLSGDINGIDVDKSFNTVLDMNSICVLTKPYKRNTFIRPKTFYEKMYDLLDKECPSWSYSIKDVIQKTQP